MRTEENILDRICEVKKELLQLKKDGKWELYEKGLHTLWALEWVLEEKY